MHVIAQVILVVVFAAFGGHQPGERQPVIKHSRPFPVACTLGQPIPASMWALRLHVAGKPCRRVVYQFEQARYPYPGGMG